jgi:Arc/MetJ-type ribon-helix-helix transcriptional regulator
MSAKQRLSASVDTHLMAAAEQAVKRGRAKNLSAWVNDAMRLKVDHDRRLAALASFIEAYEAEYGEITAEEIRLAERNARARAVRPRVMAPAGSLVKRARGRS